MDALGPLINLFALLTALSIVAERITNYLKLRHDDLRNKAENVEDERKREQKIQSCSLVAAIFLSLIVKADFFAMISQLNDPWSTLGWVKIEGNLLYRASSTHNLGAMAHAFVGCIVTGLALGFGSKFWHDVLGIVYEIREARRQLSHPSGIQSLSNTRHSESDTTSESQS